MKILLNYDYLSEIGGVERVMATHARWLTHAGHEVKLVFNSVNKEKTKYEFLKGLVIKENSLIKSENESLKLFSSLLGFNDLKKEGADLVISYSFPSLYTTRNLKCKKAFYYLPLEFIYFPLKKRIEWANDLKRKLTLLFSLPLFPILKRIDKKLIRDKLIIANSEFTSREIKQRYNLNSFVSYPPLNDIFRPQKDNKKTLEKFKIKNKFLLVAGRIIPDKRTDWAIEILSKLKDKGYKDLDLVIVGEVSKEFKEKLISEARRLKVIDKIKILGLIDQRELMNLYSSCEVFVFPSVKEAFGLVPIEAMACGTPVVAWNDFAGPNEYVINKVNGFLAKPYDLDNFTKKVEELLKIKENAKKEGKNAKNKEDDKIKQKIIASVKKFSEKEQRERFIKKIEDI